MNVPHPSAYAAGMPEQLWRSWYFCTYQKNIIQYSKMQRIHDFLMQIFLNLFGEKIE